jgi:hypothetical protein
MEKLIEAKAKGMPSTFTTSSMEMAKNWPYKDEIVYGHQQVPDDFSLVKCYIDKVSCFFDGDGKLYPCTNSYGKFEGIDVFEVGFKKAWDMLEVQREYNFCRPPNFNTVSEVYKFKTNAYLDLLKSAFKIIKPKPEYF